MEWAITNRPLNTSRLFNEYSDTRILQDELVRRGIATFEAAEKFLHLDLYVETSPFDFPQMEAAVDRVNQAIKSGEKIGVWGDFDVDGQTSTALLVDALRQQGAKVHFHVPVRGPESHGISLPALKTFLSGGLDLLITCDTGITENDAVGYLNEMKVDVIITDHHEMPALLPSAFAIINPHQLGKSHPLSYLAGVGVSYNLMRAYGQKYSPELVVNQYLDLVALGTVADIAVLKDENRFYVQRGLSLMNQRLRPSLKAIMTSARVRYKIITENTLGFVFGPRLNSAGRLDDANENIKFLISDDHQLLEVMSTKLERLNERRKYLSENLFQSAVALIERERDQRIRSVLILHRAGWEPGVLGIVAGKLAEKYLKPCILLSDEGDISSGSARSVTGINITHLLDENNEYLISHGGHSMAAGLTLLTTNLDKFIEKMNRSLEEKGYKYPLKQALQIDHFISLPDLSSDLLKEIRLLAPFGNGNAPPLFALRGAVVQDIRRFGANNEHASWVFTCADGKQTEMTYWNFDEGEVPEEPLDIAFYIQPDEYRGNANFKLEHVASRPHEPDSKSTVSVIPKLDIIDLRDQNDPMRALATILESHSKPQIFYEGLQKPGNLEVVNRNQIQKSDTLILLNPPPSPDVLLKVLEKSSPKMLYLFNYAGKETSLKHFLLTLAALLKKTTRNPEYLLSIQILAGQLGVTEMAIEYGLGWLEAHGDITIAREKDSDTLRIEFKGLKDSSLLRKFTTLLENTLDEITAFRDYYSRTNSENLLRN